MADDESLPPGDYLTLAETTGRLGVGRETLRRMIRRGDLTALRNPTNRRTWLVKAEDVERLMRPTSEEKSQGRAGHTYAAQGRPHR